jgi:pilus assembly protein CpaB
MARRIIAIMLSVLLAAAGTVVLVLYVRTAEQRALAGEETVEVLVVAEDVPRGTPAEALADRVRTEVVPVKVRATGSVDDLDDLNGRVTSAELVAGEQVVSRRFVDPAALTAIDVPEGMLQVTVRLPPERLLGGVVNPGDTVALLASFKRIETEAEGTDEDPDAAERRTTDTTHLILHKVLVTNVQGERGGQASPAGPGEANGVAQQEDPSGSVPSGDLLITLAVDAPSIERVVFTAEHGSIWLALEPDDAPEDGTRIQTYDSIYR